MIELLNWFATGDHFAGLIVFICVLGLFLSLIVEAAHKRPDRSHS